MLFWSMIISSVALFGLATAANAGMTVGLAASEGATWTFLALGLSALGAAVSQPRMAPAPAPARQRRSRG
ncbi:MAG TPA: hypothetical protein VGH03_23300 [Caulobacteraceae bacterium]|jgi:hypothetical protein